MPDKENANSNQEFTIDENLILVQESAKSKSEIIHQLGTLLFKHGFVKDTYTQAVLDREEVYPTGLQARATGVAVPHTDTEHVIRPAVAIATLKDPIPFGGMGQPDTTIQVYIVMMLAIHDPKLVVQILRKIIFIIEDDDALKKMLRAGNTSQIKDIMFEHIKSLSK